MDIRFSIAVAALIAAGCTATPGSSPATGTPAPADRPTSAPAIPAGGDLGPYEGRACDILIPDQAAEFGLDVVAEESGRGDRSLCSWTGPDTRLSLEVRSAGDPLGEAYRRSSTWATFTPATIAGQPAVLATTAEARPACHAIVGTAPDQGLDLELSGTDTAADWCAKATAVADRMMANIRR